METKGRVLRNPNVVWRGESKGGVSDGAVLFSYETRAVHYLEGIGKKIWEECESTDFEGLLKRLGAENIKDQVEGFLEELEVRGLLAAGNEKTPIQSYKTAVEKPAEEGMWSKRVYFDAPLFIQFDCTNRCNLRCKHCVTKSGEPLGEELSTAEALNLIRNLAEKGVFQIGFSGGEPLTRPDIFTLMEETKNKGMKVQITTNATLVNDEIADRLSKLDPITVGVSVEGGSKESYEYFRGEGNFERFVQGVKTLRSHGLPVKFKSAISRINLGEIDSIIKLAVELDVQAVDMFLFYPQGRGKKLIDEKLGPDEIKDFLKILSQRRRELEGTVSIDVDDKPNAFLVDPSLSHSTCGAGVYWAEVLPTGEVVPCIFFKEVVAGNVRDGDFKVPWDSVVWEPFRDRSKLGGRCGSCSHMTRCGGGCRANGYAAEGDFLAEDTLCWYEG
jgi:radical SAM protein with 4Fe4S-binding SPASM domain